MTALAYTMYNTSICITSIPDADSLSQQVPATIRYLSYSSIPALVLIELLSD